MNQENTLRSTSDNYLAFKMFKINKQIDGFNSGEIDLNEEEISKLEEERLSLLNQYYKKEYGENVVALH